MDSCFPEVETVVLTVDMAQLLQMAAEMLVILDRRGDCFIDGTRFGLTPGERAALHMFVLSVEEAATRNAKRTGKRTGK
jgi:hypothetical protein